MTEVKPGWRQHFATFAELSELGVRLSRSQISRRQARNSFPKPYLTRLNESLYLRAEVERWLISDPAQHAA